MKVIILGGMGLVIAYLVYYVITMVQKLRSPDEQMRLVSEQYLRKEGLKPRKFVGVTRGFPEDVVTWVCEKGKRVRVVLRDGVPVEIRKEN